MNYWAIITGINQYRNLQPLMYAQQDALSLWHFLVDDAAFDANCCVCLSDGSAGAESKGVLADGETWRDRVVQLCQHQIQADDLLWVFFSGYGAQFEGQDYLMPIDGDPKQIPDTALSVQWLYQQLKLAPTDNIVVVLDINRSQGALANQQIGSQTIELAKDFGIATLLSCQPTEFTHETLAVGHGLFTQALLEAVRYHGCVTLGQIADYLSDRLPELCEHHWRPMQHPVALIPKERQFLMVMPPEAVTHLPLTEAAAAAMAAPNWMPPTASSETLDPQKESLAKPHLPTQPLADKSVSFQDTPPPPRWDDATPAEPDLPLAVSPETSSSPEPNALAASSFVADDPEPATTEADDPLSGFRWVLSVAVFAVVGAFVGQLIGLPTMISNLIYDSPETALSDGEQGTEMEPSPNSIDSAANEPLGESIATDASVPDEAGNAVEAMRPTPDNLNNPRDIGSESSSRSSHPLFARAITPVTETGAASELAMAQRAIADQRFSDALIWLSQVPIWQQTTDYQALYERVEQELYDQNQRNQAVLAEAQVQADSNQVDGLNRAIFQAQQVRSGEALYGEAQATISAWSQQILALAEAEAEGGNLGAAIAMADFVPRSQPTIHNAAQAAALQWQGRLSYRQIIEQAQTLPQPGQAVSFHKAIVQVRDIPPGTPESEVAQQLTQQWSEEILTIARARAAQGRFQDAIAAARFIPTETTIYTSAQQLIEKWQRQ